MAGEREHLLAAVAASPDDDLPRLVFADWLDEQDSDADAARAAFIRAQIAEWRDPEPWEALRHARPSHAIAAAHRAGWVEPLPEGQRGWVRFERGFVETLAPPARSRGAFLKLLEKPAGETATARHLVLAADAGSYRGDRPAPGLRPADLARIAASRGLGRLRRLSVERPIPGATAAAFLTAGRLTRLETLDLPGVADAAPLFAARPPATLRRLAVAADSLRAADVAGSPLLAGLVELELLSLRGTDAGAVAAFCNGANLPRLERLTLPASPEPRHVTAALAGIDLPRLRHLTVHCRNYVDPLSEEVALGLARNRKLARLEGLTLARSPLTLEAFARLCESRALAGLKRLDADLRGEQDRLYAYLLRSDAPLRFDKLYVGTVWAASADAADLRAKYGGRLQLLTDWQLEATRQRLEGV